MEPIKTLRSRSGDTLVEVMASIFIFLLMMGILQGAVSYSSASMRKNQEIRQENAEILKELSTVQAALRDDGKNQPVASGVSRCQCGFYPDGFCYRLYRGSGAVSKKGKGCFLSSVSPTGEVRRFRAPMRTEVTRHEKKEA